MVAVLVQDSAHERFQASDQPHLSGPVWVLMHDWPLVHLDDVFPGRRAVAQSTVRSLGVVVSPPLSDEDLRLSEAVENFAVEQLVAGPGIEAFAVAVLPGRPRLYVGGSGACGGNPVPDGLRHELRTVVGPNVGRDT